MSRAPVSAVSCSGRDDRRGQAGDADAGNLDCPGREFAVAQRAEMTAEAPAVPVPGQIVVTAEAGRADTGHDRRKGSPVSRAAGQDAGDGADGDRRAFQQRDRLAAVVRARPGRLTARRSGSQQRIGEPGGGRGHHNRP